MGTEERRRREREQRYGEILEAAKKVFFSKGFNETTMDDIANESELILTFDATDENRASLETGAFRVLGDKLSGGHA